MNAASNLLSSISKKHRAAALTADGEDVVEEAGWGELFDGISLKPLSPVRNIVGISRENGSVSQQNWICKVVKPENAEDVTQRQIRRKS